MNEQIMSERSEEAAIANYNRLRLLDLINSRLSSPFNKNLFEETGETTHSILVQSSNSHDYSRYGISQPKFTTKTAVGRRKNCGRLSALEWTFLIGSTVNMMTVLLLTFDRLVSLTQAKPGSADITFALLLLINAAFCLFYIFHGVFKERASEIYALIAAILVVALYCSLEYFLLNKNGRTTLKMVCIIVVYVMAPANIIVAHQVAKKFGYLTFVSAGANKDMQRMYKRVTMFYSLLKFDLQASCSIVILVLRHGAHIHIFEFFTMLTGIVMSSAWAGLGYILMQHESRSAAHFFAAVGTLKPIYYIFHIFSKLVKPDDIQPKDTVTHCFIAAVIIGLVVYVLLMVALILVVTNFDKCWIPAVQFPNRTSEENENTSLVAQDNPRRQYNSCEA